MANPFFQLAMASAARIAGKPGRIIRLVAQSAMALRHQDLRSVSASLQTGLIDIARLLTAYARGRYRVLPTKAVISMAAALMYFLNPFDLIPDALPALGLTDDFAIVSWVYHNLASELTAFRDWEKVATSGQS
ncbi:MAG: DUF1232 domain-containing protein [Cyclobacteriaceae bacterium]|nr:DUF1232 domain-containing protein [Cyclobacteriaceae bacterium]